MGQSPPRKPVPTRSSTSGRPPSQPRRGSNRKRSGGAGRVFGICSLILLGAVSIYGGYAIRSSGGYRWLPPILKGIVQQKTASQYFDNQPSVNVLVIGRDADYNNKDQVIKTHARSDMLMVAHVDFVKKDITLLSIPRDTRATIPGHGISKINAAHAFGGPELTKETVASNFGISSQKFVALDFDGFEKAIDMLGGVDLTVDKKMDYDDNWGHLHIHLKPGYQHLTGQQAMGFVRFRHSDSDLVRVQRQQTLLAAIKEKLHNPFMLAKVPAIIGEINKHLESDLDDDQKPELAKFLVETPRSQIQMATLPSNESSGPYVLTDWDKANPMIQKIFGVSPPETIAENVPTHHRRHHRHHTFRVAERS